MFGAFDASATLFVAHKGLEDALDKAEAIRTFAVTWF